VSDAEALAAIKWSADAWTNQSHASFSYSYAGQVTDTSVTYDGRNVFVLRHDPNAGGVLGTTYSYYSPTGGLYEADVVIWDGPHPFTTAATACNGQEYLEDVA